MWYVINKTPKSKSFSVTLVMEEEIHKHHVAKQIFKIHSYESNQQQFMQRQTLWIWQVVNGKSIPKSKKSVSMKY